MHGDGQSGEDKLGRTDAPLGSVALAAVASLDEQVRGLRVRIWRPSAAWVASIVSEA